MYMTKLFAVVLLGTTLTFCNADTKKDLKLQDDFKSLDGEEAKRRDECLKNNLIKIEDLHYYEKPNDSPDAELCFYKCFYDKLHLIDPKGNIDLTLLKAMPGMRDLDDAQMVKFADCARKMDKVLECKDIIHFEKCYEAIN